MRSLSILIILLFINLPVVFAQKADSNNYSFAGCQVHYGFIIPHTESIRPVSHTNPYGFEVSFNRLHTSYEKWSLFNHYNISGLQLGYFNFQNPDILGSAIILTVFNEVILVKSKDILFSVKGGLGLSYHTRIYDYFDNQLNKFFSTSISFPLYLRANFRYRLNGRTLLTLTGSFNHISNGGVKVPNMGMNFPTVALGLEYFRKPIPQLDNIPATIRKTKENGSYLLVQMLSGYREVYGISTFAYGFHSRYCWQLGSHYGLNTGAEIIMDGGVRQMIKIENLNVDYKRIAITAGQDFVFGKAIFTQYFGIYIYSPYKAKNSIYQKYELSYKILPPFRLGFYLKAHASDAELFGLSFDYLINRKKAASAESIHKL
jgi:hypothetical protein